jgi:hypothetical protein
MNLDKKQLFLKLQLEIILCLVTAIITFMVIYPILNNFVKFDFLYRNIIFVVIFVTYTRLIFLLKHSLISHVQWMKFVIIFVSIPLVFKLIEWIFNFQIFLQTEGLDSYNAYFKPGLSDKERQSLLTYMQREFLFFGVAATISAILLPFRMLISFWRVYNKTGKV